MFEKIKYFFDVKLYTEKQVFNFYMRSVITQEQYESIIKE